VEDEDEVTDSKTVEVKDCAKEGGLMFYQEGGGSLKNKKLHKRRNIPKNWGNIISGGWTVTWSWRKQYYRVGLTFCCQGGHRKKGGSEVGGTGVEPGGTDQ